MSRAHDEPTESSDRRQQRASRGFRRERLRTFRRRWVLALSVSVTLVAVSVIGLSQVSQQRTVPVVVLTALGLVGALSALIATVVRAKAGDEIDEAGLD